MPVPKWIAQVNKRVFNKLEIRRRVRPVLTHTGRASGKTYHTPLDAHRANGGFVFFAMYGSKTDWVRNVLASGTAHLTIRGEDWDLVNPRFITEDDAARIVPADTNIRPGRVRGIQYLQMDIA